MTPARRGARAVTLRVGVSLRRRGDHETDDREIAELAALADGSLAPDRRAALEAEVSASSELADRLAEQQLAVAHARSAAEEVHAPADLRALTDRTMALLDGLGLRALLRDPTMDIDVARAQVADSLAPQLGIDASALLTQPA